MWKKHLEEYGHLQGWKMSELFVISMEKQVGGNGTRKEWRGVPCLSGPPCWMCPRDQAWTGAAGAPAFTWGASGLPVGLRSPDQRCGPSSEQDKSRWLLQHIPLPRHTHTSVFAPPCCSQPRVQHCRATQDLSRKPKGCSLCCFTPLHGTWIFGSQRTLASGEASELVQEGGSSHTPSSTVTARDPVYQDLKQLHPDKAESTFVTSPPVPVLSPALRMFWPWS